MLQQQIISVNDSWIFVVETSSFENNRGFIFPQAYHAGFYVFN